MKKLKENFEKKTKKFFNVKLKKINCLGIIVTMGHRPLFTKFEIIKKAIKIYLFLEKGFLKVLPALGLTSL